MEGSYISKGQWEIDEQRIQVESFQINLVCQNKKKEKKTWMSSERKKVSIFDTHSDNYIN